MSGDRRRGDSDHEGSERPTDRNDYTTRLVRRSGRWWKRLLGVQALYAWNLRRLDPGHMLDVGCGIGRNLTNIGGRGVGVDTNPHSVAEARRRGLAAYTPQAFADAPEAVAGSFDSLLFAHVLEHMSRAEAEALVASYLPYLCEGGKVIVIVPQEAGFASDPTHVEFLATDDVRRILRPAGIEVVRAYSFPFHRALGRWFRFNETVIVGEPTSDP